MRFNLVDQILELTPGKRVLAVKNLTLAEEYLADHFPSFPVMPGVLMLEAMVQSAAWLLRVTADFSHSVIVLREAKGIKYGNFIEPGRQLRLTVEWAEPGQPINARIGFKGKGEVEGTASVSGRFVLEQYNLRDRQPGLAMIDDQLTAYYRGLYSVLQVQAFKATTG